MHQWLDESSRDHHYTASINTFLRKYLGGLDQPLGAAGWRVVKCRPEAAYWPDMLPTASVAVGTQRGLVGCSWRAAAAAAPAPAPAPGPAPAPALPAVKCATTPMFTGALRGPSPMVLQCPRGEVVSSIVYARWGESVDDWEHGWLCWGQSWSTGGPAGKCEADVAEKVAPLCVGKSGCNLSAIATAAALGDPCHPPAPTPPVTLKCPPGQHVDYVDAPGDNGSCDCATFCAADWDNLVKKARPVRKSPLATKNLLEDTDGLRRPP